MAITKVRKYPLRGSLFFPYPLQRTAELCRCCPCTEPNGKEEKFVIYIYAESFSLGYSNKIWGKDEVIHNMKHKLTLQFIILYII